MHKMESYCLKCRKNNENIDLEISSTSNGKAMILSKCVIVKKSVAVKNILFYKFIKNEEAKGLLSKLGIKIPLSKEPILGDILF